MRHGLTRKNCISYSTHGNMCGIIGNRPPVAHSTHRGGSLIGSSVWEHISRASLNKPAPSIIRIIRVSQCEPSIDSVRKKSGALQGRSLAAPAISHRTCICLPPADAYLHLHKTFCVRRLASGCTTTNDQTLIAR